MPFISLHMPVIALHMPVIALRTPVIAKLGITECVTFSMTEIIITVRCR